MKLKTIVVGAVGSLLFAFAPGAFAEAATIGSVAPPPGAESIECGSWRFGQLASAPATPFAVPARGKEITAWQTNISGPHAADAALKLLVLRRQPGAYGGYEVVGTDTETLGESSPTDEIASFPLAKPIAVQPGDVLGLEGEGEGEAICGYEAGSVPDADKLGGGESFSPLAAGEQFEFEYFFSGGVLNVSATVALQRLDLAVATFAGPANATAGQLASLSSTISNVGEATATDVRFVQDVPSGLTVSDAVAGGGSCGITGQTVSCNIAQLAPGAKASVVVIVSPQAAGSYVSKVSVTSSEADENPVNDAAEAALAVLAKPAAPAAPAAASATCVVPALHAVSLKVATQLLRALHCTLGSVSKRHSAKVAKGAVISTQPHAGSYAAQTAVALTVSSGQAKHKQRHVTRKHGAKKHKGANKHHKSASERHKRGVKHTG